MQIILLTYRNPRYRIAGLKLTRQDVRETKKTKETPNPWFSNQRSKRS